MKALILAGGRGKRLNDLTNDRSKSMVEVCGRPLIQHNLDNAIEAGFNELAVVVGYRAEDIINVFGTNYRGVRIRYALQKEQNGLVGAIETARDAVGRDDFMLMLADEIVPNPKLKEMLERFEREKLFGLCGVVTEKEKSKISKTYTMLIGENGRIYRLIEKPEFPLNDLQGTGHCLLRNAIFDYIPKTPVSPKRGEKEMVDMIQAAIDEGKLVFVHEISDKYTNVNTLEDLEYAKTILEK